jgi:hypothetical protein
MEPPTPRAREICIGGEGEIERDTRRCIGEGERHLREKHRGSERDEREMR